MTKITPIFTSILLVFIIHQSIAQDPEFTQFYAAPLQLNPAMAGATGCATFNLNYRKQYPNLDAEFNTISFSYDQHVDVLHGGIGVLVLNDNAGRGALEITEIGAVYSYQLVINRKFSLLTGFMGAFRQRSLNWGEFTFRDQIEPLHGFVWNTTETPPPSATINQMDFSSGMVLFSKDLYVGAAVNHITEPSEGFLASGILPRKITVHAGGVIQISKGKLIGEEKTVSPNILYRKQGHSEQLNFGLSSNYNALFGGFWWRQNFKNPDALIFLVGLDLNGLKFGYSYDITLSSLGIYTGGSHELSTSYQIPCSSSAKKFKTINRPSF